MTEALWDAHRRAWGAEPDAVVAAPGRVNLIGEHVDYSLLPVMPMAIPQCTRVAISIGVGTGVRARSLCLPGVAHLHGGETPGQVDGWHRYVAAALRRLPAVPTGAVVTVGGDLPTTGGLSSSSALVVALLAAFRRAAGEPLDRAWLVREAVAAERSVGVEGGTMDQTVIVHARAGTALRLDFHPPRRRLVPMPDALAWVVGSSGESAPKGTTARGGYNQRVVGARLVAALVAAALGVEAGSPPVLGRVGIGTAGLDGALVALPAEAAPADVAVSAGIDVEPLIRLSSGRADARGPIPVRTFGRHIVSEARRVDSMEEALAAGETHAVGAILDESHDSLRDFGVVTPGLDRVVGAMRAAGAFGARVTGAGFGGYAVGACRPDQVARLVAAAISAAGGPAFAVQPAGGLR